MHEEGRDDERREECLEGKKRGSRREGERKERERNIQRGGGIPRAPAASLGMEELSPASQAQGRGSQGTCPRGGACSDRAPALVTEEQEGGSGQADSPRARQEKLSVSSHVSQEQVASKGELKGENVGTTESQSAGRLWLEEGVGEWDGAGVMAPPTWSHTDPSTAHAASFPQSLDPQQSGMPGPLPGRKWCLHQVEPEGLTLGLSPCMCADFCSTVPASVSTVCICAPAFACLHFLGLL